MVFVFVNLDLQNLIVQDTLEKKKSQLKSLRLFKMLLNKQLIITKLF